MSLNKDFKITMNKSGVFNVLDFYYSIKTKTTII